MREGESKSGCATEWGQVITVLYIDMQCKSGELDNLEIEIDITFNSDCKVSQGVSYHLKTGVSPRKVATPNDSDHRFWRLRNFIHNHSVGPFGRRSLATDGA